MEEIEQDFDPGDEEYGNRGHSASPCEFPPCIGVFSVMNNCQDKRCLLSQIAQICLQVLHIFDPLGTLAGHRGHHF